MLVQWGAHEAPGRGQALDVDASNPVDCMGFILWHRARFIGRLLQRQPIDVVVVEFDPEESRSFFLLDGRTPETWIADVEKSGGAELQTYRDLVQQASPPDGRLVAAARLEDAATGRLGPAVLYDGWHRAAAWCTRVSQGRPSPMQSYLIVTED
jgi:hypothetical protein